MQKFEFNEFEIVEEIVETTPQQEAQKQPGLEKPAFEITSQDIALQTCPKCSKKSLKIESGCHSCMNTDCGYGKCD
jgi:hypothetical protein